MAWARDATTGVLTHSGTDRDCYLFTQTATGQFRLVIQCRDYTHQVRVLVLGTDNTLSGWELGIMADGGAANTDLTIRRIVDGTPEAAVADDAHGLTSAVPFTLTIDYSENVLSVKSTQAGVAEVTTTWDNDTGTTFIGNSRIGVVSDIDQAIVDASTTANYTTTILDRNEVLVAVCGGTLYACFDGETIEEIGGGFPTSGYIGSTELDGKLYTIGDNQINEIDLVARTITPLAPTSGSLPGATTNGPGYTTGTDIFTYRGRLGIVVDRLIYFSAVGDVTRWDVAELIEGAAYVLGGGVQGLRFGEAIRAVEVTTANNLLICLENSIFQLVGDPITGYVEQVPSTLDSGASGERAVCTAVLPSGAKDIALVHSPDGLFALPSLGAAANVSGPVLHAGLTFRRDTRDTYIPQVIREPRDGLLYIFLTRATAPADGSGSTHVVYHEQEGGYYTPGQGAFFPDTYPDSFGPTASVYWRGRVLLGGRDGYIREFDTDPEFDDWYDDGDQTIDAVLPLSVLDIEGLAGAVKLNWFRLLLSEGSEPVRVKVFGGRSTEDAFDEDARTLRCAFDQSVGGPAWSNPVADAVMVAELRPKNNGTFFALEFAHADVAKGPQARRHRYQTPDTRVPCNVTLPDGTTPDTVPAGGDGNDGFGEPAVTVDPGPDTSTTPPTGSIVAYS
jgi:hypothetical protein